MKEQKSLKETIYNSILEGIFNFEYKPHQILNEKELTEKYNCSKSPVREALITLCSENVLRSIPRYGYEVTKLSIEDVREMLEFRYLMEGGLWLHHFEQFNREQIAKLEELDQKCLLPSLGLWEHWDANVAFHLQILSFCKNEYAFEELQSIMKKLKRAYAQFKWGKWDFISEPLDTRNHSAIIAAIREKDREALLKALRNDLMDFGSYRLELSEFFL